MEQKVLTLHPQGKKGVSILKEKYDQLRAAIAAIIKSKGETTFGELLTALEMKLGTSFRGSVGWYGTWVKLDMEARGEIVCNRSGSRQSIRLGRMKGAI